MKNQNRNDKALKKSMLDFRSIYPNNSFKSLSSIPPKNRCLQILYNVRVGVNISSGHLSNDSSRAVSGVHLHLRKVHVHPVSPFPDTALLAYFEKLEEETDTCFKPTGSPSVSQFVSYFDIMLLCAYRSNLPITKNKTSIAGFTK